MGLTNAGALEMRRFLVPTLWAALVSAPLVRAEPPLPAPFEPTVEDPMLAPALRPRHVLSTWDQAWRLLQAHSTDLESAEASLQRAEGRWRQSLSELLPTLRASAAAGIDVLHPSIPLGSVGGVSTFGGAATESTRIPTSPLGTAAISLSQTVFDLGAYRGVSSAQANTRSAEANLREVRRRMTQGLASALVAVVAAERAAEINRTSLRQALERSALTERTFELGAATQLDVARVNQDVAVARAALISGDEQLRRTREALGLALGIDGEVGVIPGFALEGLVAQTRQECRPLGKGELRSDLVATREQVEAAAQSRAQASAGYLPRVDLASNIGAFTTMPGPGRVSLWSVAAVLSVPVWEGGLRRGLVEELAGAEAAAVVAAEQRRREVFFEFERARRGEEVARKLVDAAKSARELALETDRLTRRSFEIGRATSLELVQSAVNLRQAELNLALREFEWVQARLDAFLTEAACEG